MVTRHPRLSQHNAWRLAHNQQLSLNGYSVLKLRASSQRSRLLEGQQGGPRAEKAGAASTALGPSSRATLRPPPALTRMPFTTVMFSFSSASKVTRRVLAVPPMAPASVPAGSERGPTSTSGPTRTAARESREASRAGRSKATTPTNKEETGATPGNENVLANDGAKIRLKAHSCHCARKLSALFERTGESCFAFISGFKDNKCHSSCSDEM